MSVDERFGKFKTITLLKRNSFDRINCFDQLLQYTGYISKTAFFGSNKRNLFSLCKYSRKAFQLFLVEASIHPNWSLIIKVVSKS